MVSEKLTENSVNVMALARMEAERAGKASVDVEHVLLGLIDSSEGIAGAVLRKNGLQVDAVREHLSEQSREERKGGRESFSFNIKAGKILNSALEFAIEGQKEFIDTEHLLLAVLAEKNWKTLQVFSNFAVDEERIRDDIKREVMRQAEMEQTVAAESSNTPRRRSRAVSPTAEYAWPSVTPLFVYFKDSAIKAVMLAQEECRRLGHNYVGSEQLLLGVVPDNGIAGKQFQELKIDLSQMRDEVEKIIGRGSGFVAVEVPFTPRAKMILTSAIEKHKPSGVEKIGAEHILLSLLDQKDGVSFKVFENLNVNVEQLRSKLIDEIAASVNNG